MTTFAKQVWDTLSRKDVSDHVLGIKLGNTTLSYIPWYRAWTMLKMEYPASTYRHLDDVHTFGEDPANSTMEVEVEVTIRGDKPEDEFVTSARLAVMDSKYKAIVNPTSRQVNDNRQRALVKALAFAGLGLNLWDDSGIPVGELEDKIGPENVKILSSLIADTKSDKDRFLKWAGVEKLADIPKSRLQSAITLLEDKARRAS
jgi:hypothetical protein